MKTGLPSLGEGVVRRGPDRVSCCGPRLLTDLCEGLGRVLRAVIAVEYRTGQAAPS